jgi:outer membrane protein OmpA-like peptidoglycan-associated protein
MRTITTAKAQSALVLIALVSAGAVACGGARLPPEQLTDARAEVQRAHDGVAGRIDPTDVHEADVALARAEKAWEDYPDDPGSLDLAVVAQRKAQIAEAEAAATQASQETAQIKQQQQGVVASQLQSARGQLGQTEKQLDDTQTQLQGAQQDAAAQRQRVQEMATKLADARATIAKIASIKDDDRGMVITLPGEVLFKTDKSDLKAGAMAKLDQIAEALKGKEQPIMVVGYTANVGTVDHNMDLSKRRAASVRDYLASKGIPSDLIQSEGRGPDGAIADNTSVDGRAQNRRVEIVVQPKKQ